MFWFVGTAVAGPAMLPYPAQTLEKAVPVYGAGFGWSDANLQVTTGSAFSGWSRYGVTDHLEAFGGAWLSLYPLDAGVHGGLRGSVGNPGGADGLGASAGLTVGAGGVFNVALPLEAGLQRRAVRAWVGLQPAVYPLRHANSTTEISATAGGDVDVSRQGTGLLWDVSALVGTEVTVQEAYGVTFAGGVNTPYVAGLGWFATGGVAFRM